MWLGGWRSASALINPKLWNRFVWPYFMELTYALVDAGVVPIPHFVIEHAGQALGERTCAYVTLEQGGILFFHGLVTYPSTGASVLQLPERLEIVDAIPLTNVGKTDRKVLKEDIIEELANTGAV